MFIPSFYFYRLYLIVFIRWINRNSDFCRKLLNKVLWVWWNSTQKRFTAHLNLQHFAKTSANTWNKWCGSQNSFAYCITSIQGSTGTHELCVKDCKENIFRKFINAYNKVNACHTINIFLVFWASIITVMSIDRWENFTGPLDLRMKAYCYSAFQFVIGFSKERRKFLQIRKYICIYKTILKINWARKLLMEKNK